MFSLPATLWRKLLRLSLAYTPPERLDSYVYVATPIISDVHTPYRRTIVPHSPPLFSRPWFEPSPRFSSHHVPQCCVIPLWFELLGLSFSSRFWHRVVLDELTRMIHNTLSSMEMIHKFHVVFVGNGRLGFLLSPSPLSNSSSLYEVCTGNSVGPAERQAPGPSFFDRHHPYQE